MNPSTTDPQRWAVAVHEAGHAVIPRLLGLRCGGVRVIRTSEMEVIGSADTRPGAVTMRAWRRDPRRRHRRIAAAHRARIMACQAGEEAELAIIGACPARAAEGDRREIGGIIAYRLHTPRLRVFILEHRLRCMTRRMVRRHRALIECVAAALMVADTLSGEAIDALMSAADGARSAKPGPASFRCSKSDAASHPYIS